MLHVKDDGDFAVCSHPTDHVSLAGEPRRKVDMLPEVLSVHSTSLQANTADGTPVRLIGAVHAGLGEICVHKSQSVEQIVVIHLFYGMPLVSSDVEDVLNR